MLGLEYLCSINNLTYTDLAKKLNISRQTVTNWIARRRNISEKYFDDLKKIFGISPEWIIKEINDIDKIKIQDILFEIKLNEVESNAKTRLITKEIVSKEVREYRIKKQELIESISDYLEKVYMDKYKEYEDDFDAAISSKFVIGIFEKLLRTLKNEYIHVSTIDIILFALTLANNPEIEEKDIDKKIKLYKTMIEAQEEIQACEDITFNSELIKSI